MTRLIAAVDAGPMATAVISIADALVPVMAERVEVVTVGLAPSDLPAAASDHDVIPLTGDAAKALVSIAGADDVAGVVVGLRSVAGGPRPTGHVTQLVLTHSDVPVVVVPPGVQPAADLLRRVLVPLEGDTGVGLLAGGIVQELDSRGSVVETIHVFDRTTVPMFWDGWHDRDLFADQFAHQFSPVVAPTELCVGDVAQQILSAAASKESSLIVIEWKRHLEGAHAPVVRDLLCNTGVPLLLVPVAADRDREDTDEDD